MFSPVGLESVTENVSSFSSIESALMPTSTVADICPGENVTSCVVSA